jgi:hypothetical protein
MFSILLTPFVKGGVEGEIFILGQESGKRNFYSWEKSISTSCYPLNKAGLIHCDERK